MVTNCFFFKLLFLHTITMATKQITCIKQILWLRNINVVVNLKLILMIMQVIKSNFKSGTDGSVWLTAFYKICCRNSF